MLLFVIILSASLLFAGYGIFHKQKAIVLRYAAWNLDTAEKDGLERRMVREFMMKYPSIRIEIDERFLNGNYNDAMEVATATDTAPDVFMYAEVPVVNSRNWCMDITNMVTKDREWDMVPRPFQEASTYKGNIIAVPNGMYIYGYYYNKDLFKERNVDPPGNKFSIEEFERAVRAMSDTDHGCIGLADESSIVDWYPAAVDSKKGWFSWDGGKFNLNSRSFLDGVNLAKRIYQDRLVYTALTDGEKKKLKGGNDWEAWRGGSVAMRFDGTWSLQDTSGLPFTVGFAGIPGGRSCIVPDFVFISSKCSHPAEAYLFAKFMSPYSNEGFRKRMELAKSGDRLVTTLPMVRDKKLQDIFFDSIHVEGIRRVFDTLAGQSYVEGYKILPGYSQARWECSTGIRVGNKNKAGIGDVISGAVHGELKIEDVAAELNSLSNECIQVYPRQYKN